MKDSQAQKLNIEHKIKDPRVRWKKDSLKRRANRRSTLITLIFTQILDPRRCRLG